MNTTRRKLTRFASAADGALRRRLHDRDRLGYLQREAERRPSAQHLHAVYVTAHRDASEVTTWPR